MAIALLAGASLRPGVAAAQSTRYPATEPDADEEADAYSDFWENAIEPGRDRYDDLVDRATKLFGRRSEEARRAAIDLLDQATVLLPDHVAAWAWLGFAHEENGDFPACRDALERAWGLDETWAGAARPLGLALGSCRARAGDLDGATEILERLVARGDVRVETLWRLGEVDIATGRLEDAQTVLAVALDQSPADPFYANAAWSAAVAADRARDPKATLAAGETALRNDPERVRAGDPPGGFLPASEAAYYMAVAAEASRLPERALLHFRRYVTDEVEGPWVERAREHVRAAADLAVSDRVEQLGTEKISLEKAAAVIAKVEPQLRACVKATPNLLVQLRVTVLGPAPVAPKPTPGKPPPPPPRRTSNVPSAGAHSLVLESYELDSTAVRDAQACIDKIAGALALPAPTTPGTWVTISAPVIWR
jgi:tetratricopeptide (TPR) repeat protein